MAQFASVIKLFRKWTYTDIEEGRTRTGKLALFGSDFRGESSDPKTQPAAASKTLAHPR